MRIKMWDEILSEIAYVLMGVMFLMLGQYLVAIMMIVVYIFAIKLRKDKNDGY